MLREFDFKNTPIVDIVNEIFIDASRRNASDIHMDPWEEYLKIRIRIDGELVDYAMVPNSIKNNLTTRIKILSGMNITETRLPQDGAIKANMGGEDIDMRVSALPTNKGEKVVIRILDYSKHVSGLDSLGFTDTNLEKVKKVINAPNGIILVTGATGSGKSTTVYSILNKLNEEDTNIITVEDPIEMDIEGVNQVQTNSEIGLDFATVLRSILRQDPDIVMIGEIRDSETAKIAVRASITGHLVLSTLHTNDALTTIERLCDMGVERYLLSSSLAGIVSQKLARKLCPKCKHKRKATAYERKLLKEQLNYNIDEVWVQKGCENCNKGYKGRLAVHETLIITQDIRDAINNDIDRKELRELVYSGEDTYTLLQDGLIKAVQGLTTIEEILKLVELDDEENVNTVHSIENLKRPTINISDEVLDL